ncbi:hypothetical protein HN446_02850 [bacterium]|jgi:hypothetical protein|nr:hypothetical protein [bacterium]
MNKKLILFIVFGLIAFNGKVFCAEAAAAKALKEFKVDGMDYGIGDTVDEGDFGRIVEQFNLQPTRLFCQDNIITENLLEQYEKEAFVVVSDDTSLIFYCTLDGAARAFNAVWGKGVRFHPGQNFGRVFRKKRK